MPLTLLKSLQINIFIQALSHISDILLGQVNIIHILCMVELNHFLNQASCQAHLWKTNRSLTSKNTGDYGNKVDVECTALIWDWVLSEGGFKVLIVKFEHFYGDCLVFKDTVPILQVFLDGHFGFAALH